ncbi:MAG: transcriptional regulator [Butyricicoccus sp.]
MSPQLLQQFSKLTEFLGRALGPDYEVALHDLTDKDCSIVAIANNHISGREIGAPLTNVALKIIADRSYLTSDYRVHYRGVSADGKMLRSSTFFIKDEAGALIGMLCINFDDSRYKALSDSILGLCHPDAFVETNFLFDEQRLATQLLPEEPESFQHTPRGVAGSEVASVLRDLNVAADRLTQDEKMEVVGVLESRGVFLLKGAVKDVAEALCCSPASVYRYLSKLRKDD